MEEETPNDTIIKSDGGNYELLRIPYEDGTLYADEVLVQVCTACGFDPQIMVLRDADGAIIDDTIKRGETLFLWSCKGMEESKAPPPKEKEEADGFTVQIGYKSMLRNCIIYDINDLGTVLKRGCWIYGLDFEQHYVEPCDAYFMIFPKKKQKTEEPKALPPLIDRPTRGILRVTIPGGHVKRVGAKSNSKVLSVLRAICGLMDWDMNLYDINDRDGIVDFNKTYEVTKKQNLYPDLKF